MAEMRSQLFCPGRIDSGCQTQIKLVGSNQLGGYQPVRGFFKEG